MKKDWFYEGTNQAKTVDYIVTFAEGEYIVDIFDSSISNNERAYLDTFCFASLAEATSDMIYYKYPE